MVFSYPLIYLFEKVSGRVTNMALSERSISNIALRDINKIRKLMRNKIMNIYHIMIECPKQRDL
jgi:membrane-associated HD superfamily phosphohydrolase